MGQVILLVSSASTVALPALWALDHCWAAKHSVQALLLLLLLLRLGLFCSYC